MLYLWDVKSPSGNLIQLEVYDSSSRTIRKLNTTRYMPYFLTSHPLTKREKEAVAAVQGEVETVYKKNLFTDELQQVSKVKTLTPALLSKITKQFRNVWENVDYTRSYIYDKGLVFGAQYTVRGSNLVPVTEVKQSFKREFSKVFGLKAERNAQKQSQIEEWFNLCHQPVPEINADLLGEADQQRNTVKKTYLAFLIARIANVSLPEASSSRRVSDLIKSMIYTHLRQNNILIPSPRELRRGLQPRKVPGALTISPQAGTYFNTVVCDFESLYPSCIDSYNLSFETVDCPHEECKTNRAPETSHHICTKRRGFYSVLIGALKDLRIRWFKPLSNSVSIQDEEKRLANVASNLLKLISVSSYGVTIRIHGVACPPLAECITSYGRFALQTTWKIAEEMGLHPTYGDTDSIFLDDPPPRKVQALIGTVKAKLHLDLAVEKRYNVCVLPTAKKAYFGIKEDGTPDLKGLTAVKSNAPKLIQKVFRRCVEVLGHVQTMDEYERAKDEIVAVTHKAMRKLKERRVNLEDLVYSVRLYHDPNERVSKANVMSQPYQCALQLINAGEKLTRRDTVHFVKVKPFKFEGKTLTVKPVSHVKSLAEINVKDYVRNLTTALQQAFKPMNIKLEADTKLTDWLKN